MAVGVEEGVAVGANDGLLVGAKDGSFVGDKDGSFVGACEGKPVDLYVGAGKGESIRVRLSVGQNIDDIS